MSYLLEIHMSQAFNGIDYIINEIDGDAMALSLEGEILFKESELPSPFVITTSEFGDWETFTKELITAEPFFDVYLSAAATDHEMSHWLTNSMLLLLTGELYDYVAKLQYCWQNLLIRGDLVLGDLKTEESVVRWNQRIDDLYLPFWLKLTLGS